MKLKKIVSVFLLSLIFTGVVMAKESDPCVVPRVDFDKYVGVWYDIARNPSFFQDKCVRSTAEYAILNANSISVKNTCFQADGKVTDITGVAKVKDPDQPGKLKVKFNFFARGDYWIVELDPAYQWAVVSGPAKKSLFILARQAPMDPTLLNQIIQVLQEKGFNTSNLIYDKY